MNPYVRDIISQPATLRAALDHHSTSAMLRITLADYDPIILSGMGSSYNAAYPAMTELSKQPIPFNWSTPRNYYIR